MKLPGRRASITRRSYPSEEEFEEDRRKLFRRGYVVPNAERRSVQHPLQGVDEIPAGCADGPRALLAIGIVAGIAFVGWRLWRFHTRRAKLEVEYERGDRD